MLLSEIFSVGNIKVDLVSRTKGELFDELVGVLAANGSITDVDKVMAALWQRESVMSTLVSPDIALPHASLWLFKKTVGVFGISKAGIDYGAPDGKPVHLVMMLIDDRYEADKHLEILKKTARLVRSPNFIGKIMTCTDPNEIHKLIVEIEEILRL